MGHAYGFQTKPAGDYLLSILKLEPLIAYSRFYDGTDETEQALIAGMACVDEPECPAVLMDLAIGLFTDMGIVTVSNLAEKLADGEQDYEIRLTDTGKQFISQGAEYTFPDLYL
jgi:hypothetical protein